MTRRQLAHLLAYLLIAVGILYGDAGMGIPGR